MYDDDTVDTMFYDAYIKEIETEEGLGFYSWLFGVSGKEIKANPKKYYMGSDESVSQPKESKSVGVITKRKIKTDIKIIQKETVGSLF